MFVNLRDDNGVALNADLMRSAGVMVGSMTLRGKRSAYFAGAVGGAAVKLIVFDLGPVALGKLTVTAQL